MDPNLQRLSVAQTLLGQLLTLVPAEKHAQAQSFLDAANAQLRAINAVVPPPAPPLVAPVLVPPQPTPAQAAQAPVMTQPA